MSSTENHKKAIKITASCRVHKGRLTDIYYKILEMQPSAIVNAAEALGVDKTEAGFPGNGYFPAKRIHQCNECKSLVTAVGIGGACLACDPRGFTE
jgi:hypothetical protein